MSGDIAVSLECDCCGRRWPSTRKYRGLGYWCDRCLNDGCLNDDTEAQNPGGRPPYYVNQQRIHAEMAAEEASRER